MNVHKNQKGVAPLAIILITGIVGIIGFTGYRVYNMNKQDKKDDRQAITSGAYPKKEEPKSEDQLLNTNDWKTYYSKGSPGVNDISNNHISSTTTDWKSFPSRTDNPIVNFTIKLPPNWKIDRSEIYNSKANIAEISPGVVISSTPCFAGLPQSDTENEYGKTIFVSQKNKKLGEHPTVIRTEKSTINRELVMHKTYCIDLGNEKYFVVAFFDTSEQPLESNAKLYDTFVSTLRIN